MHSPISTRVWGQRLRVGSLCLALFGGLFGVAIARAQVPAPAPSASAVARPSPAAPKASAVPAHELTSGLVAASSAPPIASAAPAASVSAAVEPEPEPPPEPPPPVVSAPIAPSASAPVVAAPVPSASVAPAPSSSAPASGVVRLGDAPVFTLVVPRGNKPADARAREAGDALQRAFNADKSAVVSVRREGDVAVVLVGQAPIVQLTQADSDAAGESSLDVYAGGVAAKVRDVLDAEGRRAAIAKGVFSVSLVVFFGLIAFYLIRKLGEFEETARAFLDNRSDRDLSIKVQKIEIMRPATLRSSAVMAFSLGKWLGQLAIAYAWLVVALSLFEATRNYTQRLTGFVLGPVSQLMERVASTLPLLVVAGIAALAVFVLVRFVGLFFASVARGETPLPWLPADLAAPTSILLRSALVIAALVFAAPVVTGDANGALARAGAIVLIALGLASTPLLASCLVGVTVLFGRRLRLGEFAEFGGTVARIAAIDLLEVRLVDVHRSELRVPHLLCLFRPVRVLGMRPRLSVDVPVSALAPHEKVREILQSVGAQCGHDPKVDLLGFDADGAHYRLSSLCDSLDGTQKLAEAALAELESAGILLGRKTRPVRE